MIKLVCSVTIYTNFFYILLEAYSEQCFYSKNHPWIPLHDRVDDICVPMTTLLLQPAFGFQQPLVPGMRPGPFPNFYMQMAQQGQQQVQRPGSRRAGGGGPVQQTQQHPMQMIQQQVGVTPFLVLSMLFTRFQSRCLVMMHAKAHDGM